MKGLVWRHKIAGSILGLACGVIMESLLLGLVFMPGAMLPSLILAPTLLLSVLGAWSGLPAMAIGAIACLGSAFGVGGSAAVLAVCEATIIPAVGVQFFLWRRPGFNQGVVQSACLSFGALAVLVACLWMMARQDVIEYSMTLLRSVVDSLPQEQVSMMLSTMGMAGMFGSQTGLSFNQMLSPEQCNQVLDAIYRLYTDELRQTLAQVLLTGGMTSGALSYWLSARILARRGDDPPVDYAHPRQWYLPAHLLIGPVACAIFSRILYQAGMDSADSAYLAMIGLAIQLFTVQGLGSVDRSLFRAGSKPLQRKIILAVLLLIFQTVLPIIGIASGLMGSRGIISGWLKDRNNKGGDRQ